MVVGAVEAREMQGDGRAASRGWLLLFCLMSMWVYAFRAGGAFLLIQSELHTQFMAVGFFEYPVEILGACAPP